jgi:hypothetical protein
MHFNATHRHTVPIEPRDPVLLFMSNIIHNTDFGFIVFMIPFGLFEGISTMILKKLQLEHRPVYISDGELEADRHVIGPCMMTGCWLMVMKIVIVFYICLPLAKETGSTFLTGAMVGLVFTVHSHLLIYGRFRGMNMIRLGIVGTKAVIQTGVLTSLMARYYGIK